MQQNNSLDSYVNELLEAKGYGDSPAEIKEALQKDLTTRVDGFIMARTIAEFSDEELSEFEKMLDDKKPKAHLQKFAMDHIPDFQTFLTATLIEFQDIYLTGD